VLLADAWEDVVHANGDYGSGWGVAYVIRTGCGGRGRDAFSCPRGWRRGREVVLSLRSIAAPHVDRRSSLPAGRCACVRAVFFLMLAVLLGCLIAALRRQQRPTNGGCLVLPPGTGGRDEAELFTPEEVAKNLGQPGQEELILSRW